MTEQNIAGRVAIVTVSGRRIGREIVLTLARACAAVVINGRTVQNDIAALGVSIRCAGGAAARSRAAPWHPAGAARRPTSPVATIPPGRTATPQDIARAAAALAGDAFTYMTGQVIHVNGGLFMG